MIFGGISFALLCNGRNNQKITLITKANFKTPRIAPASLLKIFNAVAFKITSMSLAKKMKTRIIEAKTIKNETTCNK